MDIKNGILEIDIFFEKISGYLTEILQPEWMWSGYYYSCPEICNTHPYFVIAIRDITTYIFTNTGLVVPLTGNRTMVLEENIYHLAFEKDFVLLSFFFIIGSLIGGCLIMFFGTLIKKFFQKKNNFIKHINKNIIIYSIFFRLIPIIGIFSYIFLGLSNKNIFKKILYIIYGSFLLIITNSVYYHFAGRMTINDNQFFILHDYFLEIYFGVFILLTCIYKLWNVIYSSTCLQSQSQSK